MGRGQPSRCRTRNPRRWTTALPLLRGNRVITASAPPLTLADFKQRDVQALNGVGPKKAGGLAELELTSLYDLLTHYPRRYIDRTNEATIATLVEGVEGMVFAEVQSVESRRTRNKRTMVNVTVTDGTGRLRLTFFNQPWRSRQLREGTQAVIFGKPESYQGRPQMTNPIVDLVGNQTGKIVPVYPQSEKAGLSSGDFTVWTQEILRRSEQRGLAEPVPASVIRQYDFLGRYEAFRAIHSPENMAEVQEARRRLVFDELFRIQVALVKRKLEIEASAIGVSHETEGELIERFFDLLPYDLTGAQSRTLEEILSDLDRPIPMHRLLQGDVGAGKTVVAVAALLAARQGGHQGALMAPTEVLAGQHYIGIRALLDGLTVEDSSTLLGERPFHVALLSHRSTKAERAKIAEGLMNGGIDLLVGTHALIQDGVEFGSLGLVVIDEQHRFGVEQRAALRDKGTGDAVPDVLVMTATPIPRTAAMTVYGDLDVSVLDELPPGRTPITTEWVRIPGEDDSQLVETSGPSPEVMWEQVRSQIKLGRQAYIVCPLIEESEKLEASSAEETYERLQALELQGFSVGLLHGRVPAADKEQIMANFRDGQLDALVATTVIEVGVDVPNATVMVILDADRFGIAQLHQLRGRVGRGGGDSWCYLVGAGANPIAEARLQALVDSTDGFELAEIDLELRGEGTIMGERQKGMSDLKLASLRRDKFWVEKAREAAFELLERDPELADHPDLNTELQILLGHDDTEYLLKS